MTYALTQFKEYIRNGYLKGIKYVVSKGVDIRVDNDWAVSYASYNGYLEVVKYLVSQGADITVDYNCTVRYASENGHFVLVKYLVSIGADIRVNNDYAVIWASRNGHLEVVKYLISQGADINMISNVHKQEIFGGKIRDFFRRHRDRKKIISMWKEIVPLYYHPEAKGGYFLKKNALTEIEEMLT